MSSSTVFAINLGGEGEIPGVLNQQRPAAARAGWFSINSMSLADLIAAGHTFLICSNDAISLPDGCVDTVYTTNVPIDTTNPYFGPGVQSSEIRRILKSGGVWVRDGVSYFTKP